MKKKYFLDVGYYIGKALEYYAPFLDDSWLIYAFEPNEELDVETSLKRFPFYVTWIKAAAWIEDGEVEFRIAGRNDASHIDGIRDSVDRKVTVSCIDFSRFVADLPEDAVIVCSFDGEGAEYPVLRKMIEDGTASRLSLLDIEFHHRLLTDEDNATSSILRQELEGLGVLVKLKLEL
jgi:FkbM family methyltransferase